jgi:hypothetical protein
VAEPGTALVFQLASGQIVAPSHPFTTGDLWWRRVRTVYTVDMCTHTETFHCTTPCAGDAIHFDASVTLTWSVHDPATVVRERVDDAAAQCSAYLTQHMRQTTRKYDAQHSAAAERAVQLGLGAGPIDLDRGVRISAVTVELALDPEQAQLTKALAMAPLQHRLDKAKKKSSLKIGRMEQDDELVRHRERAVFYTELLSAGPGSMAGNILAQDPDRAVDAAQFMVTLARQDQDLAIQAMKVVLETDQVRLGEIEPAVTAVVNRFTALISQASANLSSDSLTAPNSAPQLPSSAGVTSEERPEGGSDSHDGAR